MMVAIIEQVSKTELTGLISHDLTSTLTEIEQKIFYHCIDHTTVIWVLNVNGIVLCAWGLVPPTLVSNIAYIWLHTTDAVKEYEFIFVRKSQIALKEMLKQYPIITGHCEVGADRSIRWLKWLGAKFGEPAGKLVPFMIKAETNG